MLVVEGPDGGGKSTLVRYLAEELKFPVVPKIVAPDTTSTADKKRWTEDQINQGFGKRIYDRFCLISEPIYNPIMKPHPEPGYDDPGWLTPWTWRFYTLRPVVIWCLPALDTVKHNVLNGEDDNRAIIPYIDRIYAAYSARFALEMLMPHYPVLHDYEVDHPSSVLPIIKTRLEEWP